MKTLLEHFSRIPYGWNDMDIAGVLLTLFKKQEIRLELGGESIAASDLNVINYITKRDYVDVSCVGKGKNMVVILTTTDGRNYMFDQLDIEKYFDTVKFSFVHIKNHRTT